MPVTDEGSHTKPESPLNILLMESEDGGVLNRVVNKS